MTSSPQLLNVGGFEARRTRRTSGWVSLPATVTVPPPHSRAHKVGGVGVMQLPRSCPNGPVASGRVQQGLKSDLGVGTLPIESTKSVLRLLHTDGRQWQVPKVRAPALGPQLRLSLCPTVSALNTTPPLGRIVGA